jgi:ABC superfamily ATP binding cassette transporter, ABC protein
LTRQDLYHWYLESKERLGLTTLVITHSIEEALTLSDRIYILNHNPGEIIADLPLKWDPATDRDWQQLQYKKRIIELLSEFH